MQSSVPAAAVEYLLYFTRMRELLLLPIVAVQTAERFLRLGEQRAARVILVIVTAYPSTLVPLAHPPIRQ